MRRKNRENRERIERDVKVSAKKKERGTVIERITDN